MNRPGFAGGPGCALHAAALAAGDRPLDWKPNVCWQLPLRRDDATDGYGHETSTIREWKRRDWGEGGDDFHWWCTDSSEAFVEKRPVWQTMGDEIEAMTGPAVYAKLAAFLRAGRLSDGQRYMSSSAELTVLASCGVECTRSLAL